MQGCFTPDLNMLGCWSGVRAKDRRLFKYTKNLFRFDHRSHILRRSGALLITFLWQKNVITTMTTATYSVYLSRQAIKTRTDSSCMLTLSRKSLILISFSVPAATSQRWGRCTKMPSWKNTTSSWASCLRLWRLLPTLWLTNLLSMGVQIQAELCMRVSAGLSWQSEDDFRFLHVCCQTSNPTLTYLLPSDHPDLFS